MAFGKILLLVIAVVSIGVGVYYLLPKSTEVIELEWEHTGTAKIYMQDNGVPHIKADDKIVGMYAIGHMHARQRRWQMEYLKRLSQGRFSEILGNSTYGIDESFRTLGIKSYCEGQLKKVSKETRSLMDAYNRGVNDYSSNNTLPIQFYALWIDYEDWSIVDSCTITQLLSFMLSPDWGIEILRDYISAVSKDEELVKALMSYEEDKMTDTSITILSDEDLKSTSFYSSKGAPDYTEKRKANVTHYVSHIMNQMVDEISAVSFEGSNAWAISGEHTKSGKPLISNDPHLGNGIPSIWHYLHIEYPNEKFLSGATVPGMPFFPIFANQNITMTVTAITADVIDVYEEKIEGDKYMFEGKWVDLQIKEETIKIKGQKDKKIKIRRTRHGAILPENADSLSMIAVWSAPVMPVGDFSICWAGQKADIAQALNKLVELNFIETVDDPKAAKNSTKGVTKGMVSTLRDMDSFILNIVLADNIGKHGNIAFTTTGGFPKRKHARAGHRISEGWSADNEWDGLIKPEDKPYVINPKKGYIVMANNPVSSKFTKSSIATFTPGTSRALRISNMIEELIKEKSGSIVYQDMIDILKDVKDLYAVEKKNSMIKATQSFLKEEPELATTSFKAVLRKLGKWNGYFEKVLKEPVYFTLWEYFFRKNFITSTPNPTIMKMNSVAYFDPNWIELYKNVEKDKKHFAKHCKTYNNKESSSCRENLARALAESIEYVNEHYNNSTVTWGDLHKMAYPNIPFTRTPLRSIFDREVPASGNYNTVNVAAFKFFRFEDQLFNGLHSANLKFISEMNGTVHYSLDTGNSEDIFSGHYFDMNERHMNNDLYRVDFPIQMDEGTKPDIIIKQAARNQTEESEDL